MMQDYLKKWVPDAMTMEENIATLAIAKPLADTYTDLDIPVPSWLEIKIAALKTAIKKQYRAKVEADLYRAVARRNALKTKEEARADADEEIARIQKNLSALDAG